MEKGEEIDFVGVYVAFTTDGRPDRWVPLLRRFVDLSPSPLKRIKFTTNGGKAKRGKTLQVSPKNLERTWELLSNGEYYDAYFVSYAKDDDWIEGYRTGVQIEWGLREDTSIPLHQALFERFGWLGYLNARYSYDWFLPGTESEFQQRLMEMLKEFFTEFELSWVFVNRGWVLSTPMTIGGDNIFFETRDSIPLTSFDYDIRTNILTNYWKRHVTGAFWANFLNPEHVEALGGRDHILQKKPCSVIEELGGGRILLQVGRSPLVKHEDIEMAKKEYQGLRRFMRPILVEEFEERAQLQDDAIASWK